MGNLIKRIREKLGSRFIDKETIMEKASDNPELAGYTFKSFDSIAPHKTAADFTIKNMSTKFAYAEDNLSQVYQKLDQTKEDPYIDQSSADTIDRLIGETPAEAYGLDLEKLGPRKEWIEKKEREQQREIDKANKAVEKQQLAEQKELQEQQANSNSESL